VLHFVHIMLYNREMVIAQFLSFVFISCVLFLYCSNLVFEMYMVLCN
jgi:hypothetical protein